VRPSLSAPPFPKNGEGFHLVPSDVRVVIDGRGSRPFADGALDFDWAVTWDPLGETPAASVPFFDILTPGFPAERSDAILTVTDVCGRTTTATASYITQ
jgi:hypothetical protein